VKVAVASYSFHGLLKNGAIDIFGYLESCKYRYQLGTADIWNGMLPTWETDYLRKVKAALEERELTLENLCVDGPHLWEDDPEVRGEHHRQALEVLKAAQLLEARTLRIDAGGRGETWTDEQFDTIVSFYREYAQWADDHGFKVGPENHWGTEAVPENMLRLCQAVDHPGFGVLLHFRGTPGDRLFAPWAMHTHISWDIVTQHLEGSLSMLRDTGYTGCWSVEHHSGEHEYSEVAIQLAHVRDLLSRWE
jgi:sugar phosphate isomerase/epimerase